jgi:hypothetical protein
MEGTFIKEPAREVEILRDGKAWLLYIFIGKLAINGKRWHFSNIKMIEQIGDYLKIIDLLLYPFFL